MMKYMNNNQNNYFVKLRNEYGDDFLNCPKITVVDIQNNAIKILKDIFRNNLDLSIYGKYILEPIVLENIKVVVLTKLNYYNYLCEALEYTRIQKYFGTVSHQQSMVETEANGKFMTYNMIAQTLNSISATQNITELNLLSQRLNSMNLIYHL